MFPVEHLAFNEYIGAELGQHILQTHNSKKLRRFNWRLNHPLGRSVHKLQTRFLNFRPASSLFITYADCRPSVNVHLH